MANFPNQTSYLKTFHQEKIKTLKIGLERMDLFTICCTYNLFNDRKSKII